MADYMNDVYETNGIEKQDIDNKLISGTQIIDELKIKIAKLFANEIGRAPKVVENGEDFQEFLENLQSRRALYGHEMVKRTNGMSGILFQYNTIGELVINRCRIVGIPFIYNGDYNNPLEVSVMTDYDTSLLVNDVSWFRVRTYKRDITTNLISVRYHVSNSKGTLSPWIPQDFKLTKNNSNELEAMQEQKLLEAFPDTKYMRELDLQRPTYLMPVVLETTPDGRSIQKAIKAFEDQIISTWSSLAVKIHNSRYKWFLFQNNDNNMQMADELANKFNQAHENKNSTEGVIRINGGSAESIKDMVFEIKSSQEQFDQHFNATRELEQKIIDYLIAPNFVSNNQGRNNKQSGEIVSNSINKTKALEVEREFKEAFLKERLARAYYVFSKKPIPKELEVKMEVIEIEDFLQKPQDSRLAPSNTQDESIGD